MATLRYDKLFSGRTGGARFTLTPTAAGVDVFTAEAAGALRYLASQPGTDPKRLSVYGHSEGGLYALLLATEYDPAGLAARRPKAIPVAHLQLGRRPGQLRRHRPPGTGLRRAGVSVSYAHLTAMDHDLKHDASRTAAGDALNLPVAPGLVAALAVFTRR